MSTERKYRFYRGGTFVGTVSITGVHQPYFCGHIDPAEGYVEIAPLLDRLAQNRRQRLSSDIAGISAEKREARNQLAKEHFEILQQFCGPGLRMMDAITGELVHEPMDLEVDEKGFWWRGYIWANGTRLGP